jgi:hypothetical protein
MKTNQNYSVRFIIRKARMKQQKAPIFCRITVNSKVSEFSINRYIEPDKWLTKPGLAKGNSPDSKTLNTFLNLIENKIFNYYNKLISENTIITSEIIKNKYLGITTEENGKIIN